MTKYNINEYLLIAKAKENLYNGGQPLYQLIKTGVAQHFTLLDVMNYEVYSIILLSLWM